MTLVVGDIFYKTYVDNILKRVIPFMAFNTYSLTDIENFNIVSKYTPRCLVKDSRAIGAPLKLSSGWSDLTFSSCLG